MVPAGTLSHHPTGLTPGDPITIDPIPVAAAVSKIVKAVGVVGAVVMATG